MNRKTILKHKGKIIFISFVAVILLVAAYILISSSINIISTSTVNLLSYNESTNVDYKVYLKENEYFTEDYLPKDKQYIASLIDYIDAKYSYAFSSSKEIDATYKYKIVATLSAQYRVDSNNLKQVWANDYVLLEEKEVKISNKNSIIIDENVKIDYDKYNDIINNFKKDYMLSVTSNLTVSLLVEVNGKYVPAEKVFNTESSSKIIIPLSEQTVNIEIDNAEVETNGIVETEEVSHFNNLFILVIGVILFIGSAVLLVYEIRIVVKDEHKQSKYLKELKKILHDYGDIIVEVKNPPVINLEKSVEVKNFSELINAQIEVHSPIVFAEEIKNEKGLFVLVDKNFTYYYILKHEEESEKA